MGGQGAPDDLRKGMRLRCG